MDAGKIVTSSGQPPLLHGEKNHPPLQNTASPVDGVVLSPGDPGKTTVPSPGIGASGDLLLQKGVEPAFELSLDWEVPRHSGISPWPNSGPRGEINVSTFGNFTVAKGGTLIFETELGNPSAKNHGERTYAVSRPPAFSDDGFAYVPDRSGNIHAFDLNKNAKIWQHRTGTDGNIPSPVCGRGNRLYIRDGKGNLAALDRKTGKPLWTLNKWAFAFKAEKNTVPPPENHPPALSPDGGTLYVVGKHGTLYAVDAEKGALKKEFKNFEAGEGLYYSFEPTCDAKGRVYIARRGENDPLESLTCLDGKTGDVLWQTHTGTYSTQPVFGPDGTVYVGTKGGAWIRKDNPGENQKVMALDPDKGTLKWEIPIQGRIESVILDPSGKRLAVHHSHTNWIDAWEEIERIDNISIIDPETGMKKSNVKQATTEKEGIHAMCFAPDGRLIVYGWPDTVRAFTIRDEGLYISGEGKKLSQDDLKSVATGRGTAEEKPEKGIYADDEIVSIDGIRFKMKDGVLHKL